MKLMHGYGLFHAVKRIDQQRISGLGHLRRNDLSGAKINNSQESSLQPLEVMDIVVKRNAFGRQVDSFEIDLDIPVLGRTALSCGLYPRSLD